MGGEVEREAEGWRVSLRSGQSVGGVGGGSQGTSCFVGNAHSSRNAHNTDGFIIKAMLIFHTSTLLTLSVVGR